ncbi:hypothetical protein ACLB2K_036327 [Fragaria x ananassa]
MFGNWEERDRDVELLRLDILLLYAFPNLKPHSSLFLAPFSALLPPSLPSLSKPLPPVPIKPPPSSSRPTTPPPASSSPDYSSSTSIEVDAITEAELTKNGFRTKLICTIGLASSAGFNQLEALAGGGMNVARLNMCHDTGSVLGLEAMLPISVQVEHNGFSTGESHVGCS